MVKKNSWGISNSWEYLETQDFFLLGREGNNANWLVGLDTIGLGWVELKCIFLCWK